jgi:hypothetical protein
MLFSEKRIAHNILRLSYPDPDKPEAKFCQNAQDFAVKYLNDYFETMQTIKNAVFQQHQNYVQHS